MTSRKDRRGKHSLRPNDELHSGLDSHWLPDAGEFHLADTKSLQLARQVEEALACALASSTSYLLRELYIVEVVPLRGSAMRVLVVFDAERASEQLDRENIDRRVLEALERASGYLRAEVARSIYRKRVPHLQFAVVPTRRLADEEGDKTRGDA